MVSLPYYNLPYELSSMLNGLEAANLSNQVIIQTITANINSFTFNRDPALCLLGFFVRKFVEGEFAGPSIVGAPNPNTTLCAYINPVHTIKFGTFFDPSQNPCLPGSGYVILNNEGLGPTGWIEVDPEIIKSVNLQRQLVIQQLQGEKI